jgi:hypothetical protein
LVTVRGLVRLSTFDLLPGGFRRDRAHPRRAETQGRTTGRTTGRQAARATRFASSAII